MPNRPSPLAPLKHTAFRSLWIATLASNLGGLVQSVGSGWMMTALDVSDGMVALVQASTTLPVFFLALAAGALADNFERRKVMLVAQVFMCVVSALLAVSAYAGLLGPWSLLAFTFLIGCGGALNNPAWQSSMLDLVPKEDLSAAVSLNAMGFNMMRSVGPAVGGLIVAFAGPASAFALNAVSYAAVIAALIRWHPKPTERLLPRETLGAAMSAGLRYVRMSPNLLTIFSRSTIFGISGISILALLPVVARDVLDGGAITYGVLLGAFGFGAIFGALVSPRLREAHDSETIVRGSFLVFALGAAVLGFSTYEWLSFLALMLTGASWVQAMSLFNVSVQLSTPRWVVGRALALYQSCTFGGMTLGSWLWGQCSTGIGPEWTLVLSGVTMLLGAALGLRYRLPESAALNLDPLDRFQVPPLALDIQGRSGPIMILVEYRIALDDTTRFLALMAQRRRIRIRDGARQWALLRDLEDPEIWTESYHVPTWHEYLRHNHRRTQADAENFDSLTALHRGPERPRVHRMIERQTVPRHDDTPLTVQHVKIPGGG
ncbi:MFS transporter [Frigidibacter sp. ROC022]|uniref:MFS transporter n=1 Tax=Frigidibacter sp. ROC022 TaxID=2971796 RepID=UPI00215B0030|nr:MFS transporter [Frigidibacter sp. ROC022]MCR8725916.1 MFS transporter [Frigidibacter sp. ROC022]